MARRGHIGEHAGSLGGTMTIAETAKRLEISRSKLYALVAARRIAHYRVGGKILFFEDDVVAFLASCRVGVAAIPAAANSPRPAFKLKHVSLARAGTRVPGRGGHSASRASTDRNARPESRP